MDWEFLLIPLLGYFISKLKAEKSIIDSSINYTIFRPSYIVGKDDLFTKYLKNQLKKKNHYSRFWKIFIQPIYINDVTKLILSSIK